MPEAEKTGGLQYRHWVSFASGEPSAPYAASAAGFAPLSAPPALPRAINGDADIGIRHQKRHGPRTQQRGRDWPKGPVAILKSWKAAFDWRKRGRAFLVVGLMWFTMILGFLVNFLAVPD